jgi:hypothetical protein
VGTSRAGYYDDWLEAFQLCPHFDVTRPLGKRLKNVVLELGLHLEGLENAEQAGGLCTTYLKTWIKNDKRSDRTIGIEEAVGQFFLQKILSLGYRALHTKIQSSRVVKGT